MLAGISGGIVVLETGTVNLEWNFENPVRSGPNGWNGWICLSSVKMEVPSGAWPVMMRRGGVSLVDDICDCLDGLRALGFIKLLGMLW